jgi:hypothetical protein
MLGSLCSCHVLWIFNRGCIGNALKGHDIFSMSKTILQTLLLCGYKYAGKICGYKTWEIGMHDPRLNVNYLTQVWSDLMVHLFIICGGTWWHNFLCENINANMGSMFFFQWGLTKRLGAHR